MNKKKAAKKYLEENLKIDLNYFEIANKKLTLGGF